MPVASMRGKLLGMHGHLADLWADDDVQLNGHMPSRNSIALQGMGEDVSV